MDEDRRRAPDEGREGRFDGLGPAVWLLAALKAALHLAAPSAWGPFVDELYFFACGEHLDSGYVDMPPLTALQARLATSLFGTWLPGIHLFPALMGAGLVLLVALLARELGGRRRAQGLAALVVVGAPFSHVFYSYLSMNAVEPLVWTACALVVARIVRTGETRLWIPFGLLAGLGLENKQTMLAFGAAVVIGLLATPERRLLWNWWLLLGGLVAFVLALPNLAWDVRHGFPHLEQLANIRRNGRDVALGPLGFLGQHVLGMNPLALPVWGGGLLWLLLGREGRRYRALGVAWLATLGLLLLADGRFYYLFPAQPMLVAAGSVALERLASRWRPRWPLRAYAAALLVSGAFLAPTLLPILTPEATMRYLAATGLSQPRVENRVAASALPQLFADRCGWREMAETVARVWHALPEADRKKAAIFGNDYGEAGAIDFYGPALGLPKAIGGHLTYWLWGPRDATGEVLLVLGDDRESLERLYGRVEAVAEVGHPYAMASQHFTLFLCREPKGWTLRELWPQLKEWS